LKFLITKLLGRGVAASEIFKQFDTDGNGRINVREFQSGIGRFGIMLTGGESAVLLNRFGVEGSPKGVNFKDFFRAMDLGSALGLVGTPEAATLAAPRAVGYGSDWPDSRSQERRT
jgi:hypothetical protein